MEKYLSFLALFFLVMSFSVVSAEEDLTLKDFGVTQQTFPAKLIIQCDNCTYMNITSITYPNKTVAQSNIITTKSGTEYNYTFTLTNVVGDYIIRYQGDLDGLTTSGAGVLLVTPNGDILDISESMVYGFAVVLGIGLFLLFLLGWIYLPKENERNEDGQIISINFKKHLKYLCGAMGYLTLTWLSYLLYNITLGYTALVSTSRFFEVIYKILLALAWPITIIYIIVGIVILVNDLKLEKKIESGDYFQ